MGVFIITMVILLGADQLFKFLSSVFIGEKVINLWLLELKYSEHFAIGGNTGNIAYIFISIVIIIVFIRFFFNQYTKVVKTTYNSLPFILIISGGISNIIDRIARGFVVNYIQMKHILNTTVFNLADVYIVFGVILLLGIYSIKLTDTKAINMTEGEVNARKYKNIKEFGKKFWSRIKNRQVHK